MKIDRKALDVDLTKDQAYFTSCWFNMVHEHSLDSHRVRVMNPQNALRELLKIYELGKADEKKAVRAETIEILDNDPILKQGAFEMPKIRLLNLLTSKSIETEKEEGSTVVMMRYTVRELQNLIGQDYIKASLASLENRLVRTLINPETETTRFEIIRLTTNNLLSTLLDQGSSLESLYSFYSQILIPRISKESYFFFTATRNR